MRKLLPLLTVLLFITLLAGSAYGQERQAVTDQTVPDWADPTTWLLGYFTIDDLTIYPHSLWYQQRFDNFVPDADAMAELRELTLNEVNVTVVLGTWCSDSRREVPRFMKIVEGLDYNTDNITFIGVDSYKEAPLDSYAELGIERVPTFIFYINKVEKGRIIEYPETSLERDMINILKKR
ncbi:MAG: thioredoxin family protein [Bacteroidales bacterium]|nr:thioredoxin family protein [Bacteroidales bacterium]